MEKQAMTTLLVVVIGVVLLLIFVVMHQQIWAFVKTQGRGLISAVNDLLAGRPPWLK